MRPAVDRFAEQMEARLAEKDEEKGELGYRETVIRILHADLQRKIVMLNVAINSKNKANIIKHAVDASNYLMMIVDNLTVAAAEL